MICVTVVINVIFANVGPVFVKKCITMVCNFILSLSQYNVVQVFVCGFSGSFSNSPVFADLMLLFKIMFWDAIESNIFRHRRVCYSGVFCTDYLLL